MSAFSNRPFLIVRQHRHISVSTASTEVRIPNSGQVVSRSFSEASKVTQQVCPSLSMCPLSKTQVYFLLQWHHSWLLMLCDLPYDESRTRVSIEAKQRYLLRTNCCMVIKCLRLLNCCLDSSACFNIWLFLLGHTQT